MSDVFKLYAPIEKIDLEKRTVSGWATTEEIDKQHEVVDYLGSKEAFADWQGNIREMHEPKAVGKAVEILPNDETKKIFVKVRISKGAPDTWEKIKDGTLTGFSIGGKTINKQVQIVKEADSDKSETVTRITKYQLNELSLVDNPANAGCSFTLVKNVDGVPRQTAIVEDSRVVVSTEAEDPLKSEIQQHRDKADSLIKKVLSSEEIDALSDNDFGVIRKDTKGSTITKQRLLPMPDKMHAVRALEVLDKYSLTEEEKNTIHKKAQGILGAAYENYKNLNRGGEDNVANEAIDKLTEVVKSLADKVENLAKDMEGAYKPIPGSKETPKQQSNTPGVGESPALDGDTDAAAVDAKTQHDEGSYPYESNDPEKMAKADYVITTLMKEGLGQGTTDGDVSYAMDVVDYVNKLSDEEFDGWKKSMDDEQYSELDYILSTFSKAYDSFQKAAHPDESSLETQEEMAAPYKKVKKDGVDSEGTKYPGKHPATVDAETQKPEGAYPNKENTPEGNSNKAAGSENDLVKVVGAIDTLRKRVEDMDKAMQQARPRKYKIEKIEDETTKEQGLQKRYDEVLKWVESGEALTPKQERERDAVLKARLDNKFDKSL